MKVVFNVVIVSVGLAALAFGGLMFLGILLAGVPDYYNGTSPLGRFIDNASDHGIVFLVIFASAAFLIAVLRVLYDLWLVPQLKGVGIVERKWMGPRGSGSPIPFSPRANRWIQIRLDDNSLAEPGLVDSFSWHELKEGMQVAVRYKNGRLGGKPRICGFQPIHKRTSSYLKASVQEG